MNTKNDVEVIINGKQYTISGYESSEYLQRIATHINDKYAEFKQDEGYNRLDADMKNILLAINLSDDYYKVQESIQDLQKEKEDLEKEIFNMKHDMIATKSRLEEQEKKMGELRKDKKHSEHEVIRLETELKNAKEDNETLISIQNIAGAVTDVLNAGTIQEGSQPDAGVEPEEGGKAENDMQPLEGNGQAESVVQAVDGRLENDSQPFEVEGTKEVVLAEGVISQESSGQTTENSLEAAEGPAMLDNGEVGMEAAEDGNVLEIAALPENRIAGGRAKTSAKRSRKKRRR